MERSDSTSSAGSVRLRHNSALESGQFAYQRALLERTSSRAGTLSRASSQSRNNVLATPTPTGNAGTAGSSTPSPAPNATRRWTPTHRVGGSLDINAVRGKWEERVRSAENAQTESRPLADRTRSESATSSPVRPAFDTPSRTRSIDRYAFPPASPSKSDIGQDDYSPTRPSKRYTMPAPIIASPLSPNTTGVTVESDSPPSSSFTTPTPQRIHLPVSTPLQSSSIAAVRNLSSYVQGSDSPSYSPSTRLRRSNTLESMNPSSTGSSVSSENSARSIQTSQTSVPTSPDASTVSLRRRPASLYGGDRDASGYTSPDRLSRRPVSSLGMSRASSHSPDKRPGSTSVPPSPTTGTGTANPMFPTQYKSAFMAKRRGLDHLGTGQSVRRLERIASGDAPDDWPGSVANDDLSQPIPDRQNRSREERLRQTRDWAQPSPERPLSTYVPPQPKSPLKPELVIPSVTDADIVTGISGRRRLRRDMIPYDAPLPSSRLTRGLWADVQRHLIQAYEYLCHVGEAKEWIEGCLGEKLPFDVVEMEEQLRNGVILAKLVRVFQGEAAVRRIYEAPKLDFRHSDNINHFFVFVRYVGLPEGFVFELTDLYEKKNLPKVIYCIHALSHLLARRGLAHRIGNLVGQLEFSDDQLQKTQKGLKEAGVPMPNFGNVGRELAKEINEEPEEEPETEDERRDRLLLECEESIVKMQAAARAFLVRKAQVTQRARIRLAERYVPKLQAIARAALVRRRVKQDRKQVSDLRPWVLALQAHARGLLVRRQWKQHLRQIRASVPFIVKVQAQSRGVLQRRKFQKLKAAIRSCKMSVVKLQSVARARIAQRSHKEIAKEFARPVVLENVVAVQAHARGAIVRARAARQRARLARAESGVVRLQAQVRAVLIRRRVRTQLAKLEDVTDIVVRIQAAVRTYLARKRLLGLIRGLRTATPALIKLQAVARARLARQQHEEMQRALSEMKVLKAVGGFQARARAALARSRHQEQVKKLEFVEPDVVGLQATARGYLVRLEWYAWRDYIRSSHAHATYLQALLRGALQRRKFREKMAYYRSNLDKIVQIQSLFRAKETREQYRQLTLGTNVTVGTIKNFVHLLDDSEADFQEEIKVERLRQEVVKRIRENQALEHDVSELDVKIALVVQNVKNFEEILKARRRQDSVAVHAARASVLAAHGDPFASPSTLDRTAKRKLELYQQLFYALQTDGSYLTRLFAKVSVDGNWEKNRKLLERVTLTLFGYGQAPREEYLLLKFFQTAIRDEIAAAGSVEDIIRSHPSFINVAVHYLRPKQTAYIRETLQSSIRSVIDADDLDLETDPCIIYRVKTDLEEMRSGTPSQRPKDIAFHQALHDPDTRAEYIRHLQVLQWWTEEFVRAITTSLNRMPYGMRYMARETLSAVKSKFPDAPAEACAACVARLVYYRYINPAIITPETFDIVSTTVDIASRKNLAQISKMLTQITSGSEFGDDSPAYIPVNDYVRKSIAQISAWLMDVADVSDAETEFHAHEFLDATIQPRPIWITPNEVYQIHSLLSQHLDDLAPARDDPIRVILTELDGVPNVAASDELNDARDTAIELQLSNRFARVKDPKADEKALWVQAKRAVLAILRVQPAKDLVESLMEPVTDEHELIWEGILDEMEKDQLRHQRRMPSTTGADSAYRLEDIRSMYFREVKAHAIYFLLELEKRGKITRMDGYQGILNAIAGDVRSKNRRRVQRLRERESLEESLKHLAERKKYYEEQIRQYHDYVETAMSTMQRGKGKRRLLPFTQQYFHMRELQKAGKMPQFGSYKYSAQRFYDKGILLSIDNYSPRQFDKLDIVISSNAAGVFTIELFNHTLGITNRMGTADVKLEELLQAQFEDRASLSLFNGLAKFNLNLLLWQINKKFYR
ncbi:hypothetical protein BN946_scf184908.g100 [Trametes cinnabarina]|uniref:Ras-GAP domain-containing protein n=1 Tax=Pycnoporus cinnabarinus TaxID=5643 RepID=A0A060SA42_PYCCI|nr:hypothetical protein BN946_scf184908.g100 [Trametes cinnabarina]